MFLKFLFFTPTKVAEIPPAIFLICYSNILLSYIYTPKRNIKYQKNVHLCCTTYIKGAKEIIIDILK